MTSSTSAAWHGSLILAAGSMLDQPPDVIVDAAAQAGFDGLGLRLSGEHALADVERFRQHVADRGLILHDAEVHRVAERAADPGALIEATAAVGADRLLVVSDLADRAATVSALTDLVERCDLSGIRVGLEYMAWTNPSTPLDAIEIAVATGCELLVDLLHHQRVGAGVDELDAVVASGMLGWVQLCDAPLAPPDGRDDTALIREARHGRLPPGSGELPLTDLLARLPADVTISVEVQSDDLLSTLPFDRARLLHDAARRTLASRSVGVRAPGVTHRATPGSDRNRGGSSTGPSRGGRSDRAGHDGRT